MMLRFARPAVRRPRPGGGLLARRAYFKVPKKHRENLKELLTPGQRVWDVEMEITRAEEARAGVGANLELRPEKSPTTNASRFKVRNKNVELWVNGVVKCSGDAILLYQAAKIHLLRCRKEIEVLASSSPPSGEELENLYASLERARSLAITAKGAVRRQLKSREEDSSGVRIIAGTRDTLMDRVFRAADWVHASVIHEKKRLQTIHRSSTSQEMASKLSKLPPKPLGEVESAVSRWETDWEGFHGWTDKPPSASPNLKWKSYLFRKMDELRQFRPRLKKTEAWTLLEHNKEFCQHNRLSIAPPEVPWSVEVFGYKVEFGVSIEVRQAQEMAQKEFEREIQKELQDIAQDIQRRHLQKREQNR